jgi:hypothetical protein
MFLITTSIAITSETCFVDVVDTGKTCLATVVVTGEARGEILKDKKVEN